MKRREFLALLAVGSFAGPAIASQQVELVAEPAAASRSLPPCSLKAIREWLEGSGVSLHWFSEPIMGPNQYGGTCCVVKDWGLDHIEMESRDGLPLHTEITQIVMGWLERGDWYCAELRARTCERTGRPKLEKLVFEGRFPS